MNNSARCRTPPLIDYSRATAAPRPGSVLFFGRHTPRKGTAWALSALGGNASVREIRLVGEIIDRKAVEDALAGLPAHVVVTKVDRIVSDEEAADELRGRRWSPPRTRISVRAATSC